MLVSVARLHFYKYKGFGGSDSNQNKSHCFLIMVWRELLYSYIAGKAKPVKINNLYSFNYHLFWQA
jgi:hypothetical protein